MNLHNEDHEIIYHVDSPVRGEMLLLLLASILLTLVLRHVAPVKAEPSPVTPHVAQLLGWCETTQGK